MSTEAGAHKISCWAILAGLAMAWHSGVGGAQTPPIKLEAKDCFSGEVMPKVDRFTGDLHIATPAAFNNFVAFRLLMLRTDGATRYFFAADSSDDDWEYLKCNSVAFLVDGKRFGLPYADHDGEVHKGGFVTERLVVPLTENEAVALATGSSVEWRICRDEFVATPRFKCLAEIWWRKVQESGRGSF